MADTKYLKCLCARCGGRIEFPAEGIGMTAPCPHCGWQTELALEVSERAPARSRRSLKWAIAGVIILLIGVVGAVSAVLVAQKLAKKSRVRPSTARSSVRPAKTNAPPGTAVPSRAKRAEYINDFAASEVRIEKSRGSSLVYAGGTLKNETDKQRFDVTVEVELLDDAERKIGTAKDYKDVIEPRGQWTFRALVVHKNASSARIAAIREQP
jgi:hypothetical protein